MAFELESPLRLPSSCASTILLLITDMKKLIVLLSVILMPVLVKAQDNQSYTVKDNSVVVEKVIPFDVPMSDAVLAVRDYFVKQLKDSNETLKLAGDDIIIVKIVTPVLATHSMGSWKTRGELTIEVKFKDSRMKANVSCSEIRNYSDKGSADYCPVDAAPLNPEHNIWKINVPKKTAIETFDNLVKYMNTIVLDIEKAVANIKVEEDW